MATYARLDAESRLLAEDAAKRQSGRMPCNLVLLYACRLDHKVSGGRKLMEAALLSSEPWDYVHGRVLLVYSVGATNKAKVYDDSSYQGSTRSRRRG